MTIWVKSSGDQWYPVTSLSAENWKRVIVFQTYIVRYFQFRSDWSTIFYFMASTQPRIIFGLSFSLCSQSVSFSLTKWILKKLLESLIRWQIEKKSMLNNFVFFNYLKFQPSEKCFHWRLKLSKFHSVSSNKCKADMNKFVFIRWAIK